MIKEGKTISKNQLREKIDIVMVTFNRLEFLKKVIFAIKNRTKFPYRLIIVDNNSFDGTKEWLISARDSGLIDEYILLKENVGLAAGLSEGFKLVESEYFVATQDDLIPPKSEPFQPCWLEKLVDLFKKYEKDYGGIAMLSKRVLNKNV